jgi:hypothetical protein
MSRVQLASLISNAGSDASTAVISVSNLDDIVQSRPRQVFLYQVSSYLLPFSVLTPYWGIVLYDPANVPPVPTTLTAVPPALTARPLLTTQTSLTNNWLPVSPPYYRLWVRQVIVATGGSPITVYSGENPIYSSADGFTIVATGLTANTAYTGAGRVQLDASNNLPYSTGTNLSQSTSP